MKKTKKTIAFSLLLVVGMCSSTIPASAQKAGPYKTPPGGVYRVLANSTNVIAAGVASTNTYGLPGTATNLVFAVTEFDYVGFTWSYGNGSNETAQVFQSRDGGVTFEATPSWSFSGPAATAGAFATNALLDCRGVTHLGVVLKNASTLDETNAYVCVYLKSPKYGSKVATQ